MVAEESVQLEERKIRALESIGTGLHVIAEAILQHATVNAQDIARGLNNISASIANSEFGRSTRK